MAANEVWRNEPWAQVNLAKWETLKLKGWRFKKAEPRHRETGVSMWKDGRDHVASVYVVTNSDTTRQEVYESWVESCEKIDQTSSKWHEAVPQMRKMEGIKYDQPAQIPADGQK